MNKSDFADKAEHIKGRLYRTAFLYLCSEAMAMDAVDEAIYRGFLSFKKLREPAYFETWLTRILINECKKELRRSKRVQTVDTLPERAQEDYDALPLKEALRRLPRELQDIIVLRYFTGFTLKETAEILALPQGTVVTRQRRALALLKLDLMVEE